MGIFKFYKKNDKYIWEGSDIKLEISDVSFQAYDEYMFVKSLKDILYLYYTVNIYANKSMTEKTSWELVSSCSVHDFPGIIQLKGMLDTLLHTEIDLEDCRRIKYYNRDNVISDMIGYEYTVSTEGFAQDDFYEISKTLRVNEGTSEEQELFSIFLGTALDVQGDRTHIGIRTNLVNRDDLEELYKMATTVLDESISEHNRATKKMTERDKDLYKSENGRIYQYNKDGNIQCFFTIADTVDIRELVNELESDNYYSVSYDNAIITGISEDGVYITGSKEVSSCNYEYVENEKILLKNIISMFYMPADAVLHYKEKSIASDFVNNLYQAEIEEFKKKSEEELYEKWVDCLIDRYWMCRSEHKFKKRVKDTGNHENVKEAVKVVISEIKIALKVK